MLFGVFVKYPDILNNHHLKNIPTGKLISDAIACSYAKPKQQN
jgi:hypothetical protein